MQVDPEWPAQAPRPFDPYLTEYGEKQVSPAACTHALLLAKEASLVTLQPAHAASAAAWPDAALREPERR